MDSSKIDLQYIYADEFSTTQETSVYGNGEMQVSIFVSFNYEAHSTDDAETISDVQKYVQEHSVIYSLTESKNVDWEKSYYKNEFEHDINRASGTINQDSPQAISQPPGGGTMYLSDLRVPLYFTVPQGTSGQFRWIAKLQEQQTSPSSPVTITATRFEAPKECFEIQDLASTGYAHLRVLRYKPGAFPDPAAQRLVKPLEYQGIRFNKSPVGNCWISMLTCNEGHKAACFIEYKDLYANIGYNSQHYYAPHDYSTNKLEKKTKDKITCSNHGWSDAERFTKDQISKAWSHGIPMIKIAETHLHINGVKDFWSEGISMQDNFGNKLSVHFDWNVGDWWGDWAVSRADIENN